MKVFKLTDKIGPHTVRSLLLKSFQCWNHMPHPGYGHYALEIWVLTGSKYRKQTLHVATDDVRTAQAEFNLRGLQHEGIAQEYEPSITQREWEAAMSI